VKSLGIDNYSEGKKIVAKQELEARDRREYLVKLTSEKYEVVPHTKCELF
jgi:hypothetical protein